MIAGLHQTQQGFLRANSRTGTYHPAVSPPLPDRVRLVIFDLDGVIYRGTDPVPRAVEVVGRLRVAGARVAFATNNSMATRVEYAERLAGMGVPAEPSDVMTSNWATVIHLRHHLLAGARLLIIGAPGMVAEFEGAGFAVTSAAAAPEGEAPYDAVVVGLDQQFDYRRLAVAGRAARTSGLFVATNADARYPVPGGFLPGAGAVVAAVRATSGREPTIIGKPQPAMFTALLEEAGIAASATVVVGDNPDSDMPAASRAGIASVLVLTGVTAAGEVGALSGEQLPTAVAADPTEVWELLGPRVRR